MSSTDRAWKKWGQNDPYFGVCSSEQFRGKNITDADIQGFFESGKTWMQKLLTTIDSRFPELPNKKVLDFGCGTGRFLPTLADRFDSVLGVDISQHMIDEAMRKTKAMGIDNINVCLSDQTLSKLSGKYDFIHSYIVFQHIKVDQGMLLLRELLRSTEPSGVVALHFTFFNDRPLVKRMIYRVRRWVPGAHKLANLIRGLPIQTPLMQMNSYDTTRIIKMFHDEGFKDIQFLPECNSGYYSSYVISQKDN